MKANPGTTEKIKGLKFVKHEYDLDIIKIHFEDYPQQVKNCTNQKQKIILKEIDEFLIRQTKYYCEFEKIDFNFYLRNNQPLLIPSHDNMYHSFLEVALYYYDIQKIPLFLNYQLQHFEGNHYAKNKSEFVGLIEFIAYDWIKNRNPLDKHNLLKALITWVQLIKKSSEPYPLILSDKRIMLNEKNFQKAFDILSPFFVDDEKPLLVTLLKGDPIKGKIVFHSKANKLIHAFLMMQQKKIIIANKTILGQWIYHYFQYASKNAEVPKDITTFYSKQILTRSLYYCQNPIKGIMEWLG